jgi:hypothetical protein
MSFFPILVDVVECRQDYDTLCFDGGCTTRSLGKARRADQTASFRYGPDQRDDCEVKALQPWCDRLRCCSKGTEVDPLSASRVMTGQFWWYSSPGPEPLTTLDGSQNGPSRLYPWYAGPRNHDEPWPCNVRFYQVTPGSWL